MKTNDRADAPRFAINPWTSGKGEQWWRAKNRRSANMVNAASEMWLIERGLRNWRHARGAARFNSY